MLYQKAIITDPTFEPTIYRGREIWVQARRPLTKTLPSLDHEDKYQIMPENLFLGEWYITHFCVRADRDIDVYVSKEQVELLPEFRENPRPEFLE